jgi:hypothetical protein
MEFIDRNEGLLAKPATDRYCILDSQISRFDVYYDAGHLYIDVYMSLPYSGLKVHNQLKLHFIGVNQYDLNWNDKYHFYTIETYKFLKSEKGYYISFDPYDESEKVLDEDRDIIFSKEVEGYLI